MYKFLLLGASSSLGSQVVHDFEAAGIVCSAYYRSGLMDDSLCVRNIATYNNVDHSDIIDAIVVDFRGCSDIHVCEKNPGRSKSENFEQQAMFFQKYRGVFKKYIFISSSSVVGDGVNGPLSRYAYDKMQLELKLSHFDDALALRIHSTYGEFQKKMFVFNCYSELRRKGFFDVASVVNVTRDLIHQSAVSDVILYSVNDDLSGVLQLTSGIETPLSKVAYLLSDRVSGSRILNSRSMPDLLSPKKLVAEIGAPVYQLEEKSFPYKMSNVISVFDSFLDSCVVE